MLLIQVWARRQGNEEPLQSRAGQQLCRIAREGEGITVLTIVGVLSSICHAYQSFSVDLSPADVLICELFTIDRLPTSAISFGNITTLDHELVDDSVECGELVSESIWVLGRT